MVSTCRTMDVDSCPETAILPGPVRRKRPGRAGRSREPICKQAPRARRKGTDPLGKAGNEASRSPVQNSATSPNSVESRISAGVSRPNWQRSNTGGRPAGPGWDVTLRSFGPPRRAPLRRTLRRGRRASASIGGFTLRLVVGGGGSVELGVEGGERAVGDGGANLAHAFEIEMKVVVGVEDGGEDLVGHKQMTQV